jgi:uncharacterized protein (DUF58 family)
MSGRRFVYAALIIGAGALHFAYGQYVTFYILLFLLSLPVLSLLISLPAILTSRADLSGGADVRRGRTSVVRLKLRCGFFLPPEAWKLKIERQNLFLEPRPARTKTRLYGGRDREEAVASETGKLGAVLYRIRSARVCDYLGLFAIPIRRGGAIVMTVFPNEEAPVPMPELVEPSDRVMKPKPLGFSEEHELRPYREGDAVNLIHWKLTEKTDTPIVREPQELFRKKIVICMDRYADYDAQQSALEQLSCLAGRLNGNGVPFLLYYGLSNVKIEGEGDFDRFLRTFLSELIRDEKAQPVIAGNDTIVYRIVPQRQEVRV